MAQFSFTHRNPRDQRGVGAHDAARQEVSPLRLVLHILHSNRTISVPIAPRLVVGRDGGTQRPDVDLSDYDGATYGISRLHCVFTFENDMLFVEDLNSENGTRINGYRIPSGTPYRLRSGDELEIGALRISAKIMRPLR